MSSTTLPSDRPGVHTLGTGWKPALLILLAGVVVLGVLFHEEAVAAVGVWWTSTAYGHCFLVGPIAAWLAWERRGTLAGEMPRPMAAVAVLALPLAAGWFLAERLSLMEGRQLCVLFLAWLLVPAVLGLRITRAMAVPLAYTIFLVPFGNFLVPMLQTVTAKFVDVGLSVLDVPHVVTATLIEIPEGAFEIVEACAGLRFLIAAIAFGALYACVIYRSALRRMVFIAVCVVVPVVANGLRALGIVMLGHLRGSAEAGAVDHVLYGWIFFSLVLLLLLLLGLPYRQDQVALGPRTPVPHRPATRRGMVLAGILAVVLAASGPAAASWLAWRAQDDDVGLAGEANRLAAALAVPADCTAEPAVGNQRRITCHGVAMEATVQLFGLRHGAEAVHAWHDATAIAAEESRTSSVETPTARWQVGIMNGPDSTRAAALWLDGQKVIDGLRLRLRLARAGFGPAGGTFLLISLATSSAGADTMGALTGLATALQPPPSETGEAVGQLYTFSKDVERSP